MNETNVTVSGFVAAEPHFEVLASGTALMSLRVGCTPRRFDREIGQWRDEDSLFMTVTCWRSLANNLHECELKRGDPVIVTGRLRLREYVKDGQPRLSAQVEATTVGLDLSRAVARLQRSLRASASMSQDRRQADDLADRWLDGARPEAAGSDSGDSGDSGGSGHDSADATEGRAPGEFTGRADGRTTEAEETTEPGAFRAVA